MVPRLLGINKYVQKTRAQKDQIRQGAANFVRSTTKAMLRELVLNTPQWSGDLAASWRIDLHSKPADVYYLDETYDWKDLIGEANFKGDVGAWKVALAANEAHLKAIRYNSIINIINIKPIAVTFATGTSNDPEVAALRPGNYIPGDIMAIAMVSQKFKLRNNITGLTLKTQMNYDD